MGGGVRDCQAREFRVNFGKLRVPPQQNAPRGGEGGYNTPSRSGLGIRITHFFVPIVRVALWINTQPQLETRVLNISANRPHALNNSSGPHRRTPAPCRVLCAPCRGQACPPASRRRTAGCIHRLPLGRSYSSAACPARDAAGNAAFRPPRRTHVLGTGPRLRHSSGSTRSEGGGGYRHDKTRTVRIKHD